MQSRHLLADGLARLRSGQFRRTLGAGRKGWPSSGFLLPAMAAAGIATLVLSCGEGAVEPAPPPTPVATTVAISPASATLTALGETARFTAEVRDQNGQVMAGAAVAWTSSDASVAAVDASGEVTSAANGSVTITATAGSVSGTAAVTVAQVVDAVTVSPAADTLVAFGDTVRLVAEAADANGHAVAAVTEFVWSSSDTLVAKVDDTGLVETVTEGEAVVTATASGVTGEAELSVVPPLPTTVLVSPDTLRLTALGQTGQLAAEVREQAGRVMAEAFVSWSSGDTLVAVVDSVGLVTAVGGGTTTVTATVGEVSATTVVSVMQASGSVVVLPAEGRIGVGDTLRLTAEAFDENGHRVEGAAFSWSSSDAGVARVDESGLVEAVAEGTARITATAGDASGVVEVTVENPDRAALVALYEATDGPNWVNNENWLTDAPLGEWYGVETDASGRVQLLDLGAQWDGERFIGNGLSGSIPPELGNLSNLEKLSLGRNRLTGTIPPELGRLGNLRELYLGPNGLYGNIPSELGSLGELQFLSLAGNLLSGNIPPALGALAKLENLLIAQNGLDGPIPRELGNLTELRSLRLNHNELEGLIPPQLGNLTNLQQLNLTSNNLVGPIPPELGNLATLRYLSLARNGLTGRIPPGLGNLVGLEYLGLGANGLSGEIPPELGNLVNLQSLVLNGARLSGRIPPELGNLVSLEDLWLNANDLSGPIPSELGNLRQLRWLWLHYNQITGPFPQTLLDLPLSELAWNCGAHGLCVPGTSEFVGWLDGISKDGPFCNASDQATLGNLFELMGGEQWGESSGWLGSPALEEWHGVQTDSLGRVTALHLSDNRLSGGLPADIADLSQLTEIRIDGNDLGGRLPLSLTRLDLRELHYDGTTLCEPADPRFQTWLRGIESHSGTATECASLTDRDVLVTLYEGTGGPNWKDHRSWLSDAPLGDWYGVEVDDQGRVVRLDLGFNNLIGVIPPELGGLASLERLRLAGNDLSGPIPPELGDLAKLTSLRLSSNDLSGPIPLELRGLAALEFLDLGWNSLSGPIPPELGGLAKLTWLRLSSNDLSSPIPSELGDLAKLTSLRLSSNDLSGRIPPELGKLADLWNLELANNNLSGPVPAEIGGLEGLRELELARNPALAGAVPATLRDLRLRSLQAGGTDLCVPREAAFEAWLEAVPDRWIAWCGDRPLAYLTQAVQSHAHPVPLVAGDEALLRVFVTAARDTTVGMPAVRARFYLDGSEQHVVNIAAKATPIPAKVDEGDLGKSANARIPGRIVRPGLEMVVEIDPDGSLNAGLGLPKRIPETGRMALDVREMPVLDLTLIPFLLSERPDSVVLGAVEGMASDPKGHDGLKETRDLLPVGDLVVSAHDPVVSTRFGSSNVMAQVEAIRALEGGTGHYMGLASGGVTPVPFARVGGRTSVSDLRSGTIAHELGHNMSLLHAPCGAAGGPDPLFPERDGSIGAWGYDFETGLLVEPGSPDLMSYCYLPWIGGYHFANALQYRVLDESASALAVATPATRSLLLWGGTDAGGESFLNPAFVVDAPPALPDLAGDYTVTGRDASGGELFSLSFAMPEVLSEEEAGSGFAFVLPVRPAWADALARITLSGPDNSVTLDRESDQPMAILRDPRTGQVRGFLRDLPTGADAVGGAGGQGLQTLFSRGIPGADAWRR